MKNSMVLGRRPTCVEKDCDGVPKPWVAKVGKSSGCFQKSGCSPQIIHFNRVFHYFHHPFWGPTPIFGKHPSNYSKFYEELVFHLHYPLVFQCFGRAQSFMTIFEPTEIRFSGEQFSNSSCVLIFGEDFHRTMIKAIF